MKDKKPLEKSRDDYAETIEKISAPNSPVGIDAQYTHAIIIDYLQLISRRLDAIEERIGEPRN